MAAEYPETMQQLFNRFRTNEDCLRYLRNVRWGKSPHCSSCASASLWPIRRGYVRCAHCRSDMSATQGTAFAHSHIPLKLWFLAIWCIVSQKQGMSALGLSRALGINRQKTGWELLHKIRRGMIRPGRDRLSGLVEIDEIIIGGERHTFEGRSPQGKTLVLVAAEDRGGQSISRIRIKIKNGRG